MPNLLDEYRDNTNYAAPTMSHFYTVWGWALACPFPRVMRRGQLVPRLREVII